MVLAALLLVALGMPLAYVSLRANLHTQRRQALRDAEQRWNEHGISAYGLELEENNCQYVSQVNGRSSAVEVRQGSCTTQPSTVPALFAIADRDGFREWLCDTQGCPCESSVDVAARYDTTYGVPLQLEITIQLRPAWFTGDLWRHLLRFSGLPPCWQTNQSHIRVLAFAPAS